MNASAFRDIWERVIFFKYSKLFLKVFSVLQTKTSFIHIESSVNRERVQDSNLVANQNQDILLRLL